MSELGKSFQQAIESRDREIGRWENPDPSGEACSVREVETRKGIMKWDDISSTGRIRHQWGNDRFGWKMLWNKGSGRNGVVERSSVGDSRVRWYGRGGVRRRRDDLKKIIR